MTNEELFKRAIKYAFPRKTCEDLERHLEKAKGTSPDADTIIALCSAINRALKDNDLDWNASDSYDHCERYKEMFELSYLFERWETLDYAVKFNLPLAALEALASDKEARRRCHHYDVCRDPEKCPKDCSGGDHLYLNEFDHLLHYLAVNVWMGKSGTPKTSGLTVIRSSIGSRRDEE